MRSILALSAVLSCLLASSANAEKAKAQLTPEQKALRKELLARYDSNKDGKLDKQERAKVSKEDQERLEKAGLAPRKKKNAKTD